MLKYILIGLAILGAGVGAWFFFKKNSNESLAAKIKELGGTGGDVSSFDKPFLKAWLKALENNSSSFELDGKYYNSMGGKRTV